MIYLTQLKVLFPDSFMSKKPRSTFERLRQLWFIIIITIIIIIFIYNREIGIWVAAGLLATFILYYVPSLSFKKRLARFMKKYNMIEDKTIAQNLTRPLEEIRETMRKLSIHQKRNKWLITFLNDRYIFYHKITIKEFNELYYKGYNEKRIFETLKPKINIRTRAEIKAIEDTLIHHKRLKSRKISDKKIVRI